MLNPVGDVVVDPAKILKTVNIRSISDVVPITMSSDVNIGSIGTDTKTLNTDHIRPLTAGGRTDFSDTTMSDLKVATISPTIGGMTIDMNKASITSGTMIDVVADLKAVSLTTDAISTNSTPTGMTIDLVNSDISSSAGVRVSNVYSQDTTFNSITPISKALAVNGDIKMLQDATVYTDKLGASVAQNVTVNNDMVINPDNKPTATNIDVIAINNVNNPYGLRVLTDASTITSGSDILVTLNNLFKVYGPIQSDTYQPLTIDGDITLATVATANVILYNLKANKIIAPTGNDLFLTTDPDNNVKIDNLLATTIGGTSNTLVISNNKASLTGVMTLQADNVFIDGSNIYIGLSTSNGQTIISNNGIKFGTTGNALLNAYEVNTYTGTFSNMTTTATSFTIRFTKIGNVVTVSLDTPSVFSSIQNVSGATFSVNIDSKYRRSIDVILPAVMQDIGGGSTQFRIKISVLGNLTIVAPSNVVGIQYLMIFTGSYIVP